MTLKAWCFAPICLALTFVTLLSCASAPAIGTVTVSKDRFRGDSVQSVQVTSRTSLVSLVDEAGEQVLMFVTEMHNLGGYANVDELVFLLDNERLSLRGVSKLDDVTATQAGVYYSSASYFGVTADELAQINAAKVVEVKVYGDVRTQAGRTLPAKSRAAMQDFYDFFVTKSRTPAKVRTSN